MKEFNPNKIQNSIILCTYIYIYLYVRSIITYTGLALSLTLMNTNWKKIETVQNISLRTILVAPSYVTNNTLVYTGGLLNIKEYILKNSKILFYKKLFL